MFRPSVQIPFGQSYLESRLDQYIRYDRENRSAPEQPSIPALDRRVRKTAAIVGTPFVPRDWLGIGHSCSFLAILLDEAKR